MHPPPALSLLLLALTACGGEDRHRPARPDAFILRDSAGIEITESTGPAWGPGEAWRLTAEPVLEIGQADGAPEYLLNGIGSAWRTSSGGVVLANTGSLQIRFYDGQGRHLRTVGGGGGGPGEFAALAWIRPLAADSVLAFDHEARRLSFYTPEGDLARSFTLGETLAPDQGLIGVLGDGSLVVRATRYDESASLTDGRRLRSETFLHLSAEGVFLDTISAQPALDTYRRSETLGVHSFVSILPPLFARVQVSAVSRDRVILGSNDGFRLDIYTPDGQLTRSIRAQVDPRAVTADLLEALRRAKVEATANPEMRQMLERSYAELPHASVVPFYERILPDDGGNLWVQGFAITGEDPLRFTVFDGDGRMLGDLLFPTRFRPLHIGIDFVLGVWKDQLGVERVRVYGLEKG